MSFLVTLVRAALLAGVKASDVKLPCIFCLSRDCMRPHKAPDQSVAVQKVEKAAPKESNNASGARSMPCQRILWCQPYSLADQTLTYSSEKTNYLYDSALLQSENWSKRTKRKNDHQAKIGEDPMESCMEIDEVMDGTRRAQRLKSHEIHDYCRWKRKQSNGGIDPNQQKMLSKSLPNIHRKEAWPGKGLTQPRSKAYQLLDDSSYIPTPLASQQLNFKAQGCKNAKETRRNAKKLSSKVSRTKNKGKHKEYELHIYKDDRRHKEKIKGQIKVINIHDQHDKVCYHQDLQCCSLTLSQGHEALPAIKLKQFDKVPWLKCYRQQLFTQSQRKVMKQHLADDSSYTFAQNNPTSKNSLNKEEEVLSSDVIQDATTHDYAYAYDDNMYKLQQLSSLIDNIYCDLDGIKIKDEFASGVNSIELDYANTFVNYDDQINATHERNSIITTTTKVLKSSSRYRSLSCEQGSCEEETILSQDVLHGQMTRNEDHQCNKTSFKHDANVFCFDENYLPFLDPLNFKFEQVMISNFITYHDWFTNKVFEEECLSQCINMKIKTLISNEKNTQSDDFLKDWNESDEDGIDFDSLAYTLKPSLYTDFILETKLLQLLPCTEKVNVALHDDLNKRQGISLKALEQVESKKEEKELELVFLKLIGSYAKTIAIDIKKARSEHAFKSFIDEHLRGKQFPPNAAIEVLKNGYALKEYRDVQHGDTLQLSLVRHGLCGGMLRRKKDRIHPDEEDKSKLIPNLEQLDVDENLNQTQLDDDRKFDQNQIMRPTIDWKEQVKNILIQNKIFAMLITQIGEDNFWSKFLQVISKEEAERIVNVSNERLQMGQNPDNMEEIMNIINRLPDNKFMHFFEQIKAQLEINKKQEQNKDSNEQDQSKGDQGQLEEIKGNQEQEEDLISNKMAQIKPESFNVSYDRLSVSADKDVHNGEVVEFLLDKNETANIRYVANKAAFNTNGPVAITINVDKPIILTHYGIKSANNTSDWDPKQWEFVAVYDDESELVLHKMDDETEKWDERWQWNQWEVNIHEPSKKFILRIKNNNSDGRKGHVTQMSQLVLNEISYKYRFNQLNTEDKQQIISLAIKYGYYLLKKKLEDDEWFIEKTQIQPTREFTEKEEYEYFLMRLLTKLTQQSLNDQEIFSAPILKDILKRIKSEPLKTLFIDLYFIDGKEKCEVTDFKILNLMKEKAMHYLRQLPQAQELIEKRLIDKNLYKTVGLILIKLIIEIAQKEEKEGNYSLNDFFDENLKVFKKETQQLFFNNIKKETQILELDYTDPENIFPADLLMQSERKNDIEVEARDAEQYIADYPIFCYKKKGESKLVMVHLADLDAQNMIYEITSKESYYGYYYEESSNSSEEELFALIEPNIRETSQDVKIQLLVKDSEEKIKLRTLTYSRPFEKKEDFCDLANWQQGFEEFPVNNDLIEKLKGVLQIHLVVKKGESEHSKFGLIIQNRESVFFYDMEGSQNCVKLLKEDCEIINQVYRGVNDSFYIAANQGEKGKLQVFNVALKPDVTFEEKTIYEDKKIKAFVVETTLAIDEQSSSDQIFVLLDDRELSLLKIDQSKQDNLEPEQLSESLPQIHSYRRDIRNISVSGNYLIFCDKILNYTTGCLFDLGSRIDKSLPCTNMYVGIDEKQNTYLIRTKLGSRERKTFAHRQKHVRNFELLNSELMLAELECLPQEVENSRTSYWSLMDTHGDILMLPDEMKELLEKSKWIKSLSKAVKTIESQDLDSEPQEGILIVLLSDHKKTITDSDDIDNLQLSLLPDIAAILLDRNCKYVRSQYVTREKIMQSRQEQNYSIIDKDRKERERQIVEATTTGNQASEAGTASGPNAPFSIGKYQVDGNTNTWVKHNTHDLYQDVFSDHSNESYNDWAYGFNRLHIPGSSKIKVRFQLPVEKVRKNNPNAKFIMRTACFAPMNVPTPCEINVSINDKRVLKKAQVPCENEGRTIHDTEIEDVSDQPMDVEIHFLSGDGVLFLWYFEILVQEEQILGYNYFKPLITEKAEIILVYADPSKQERDQDKRKVQESRPETKSEIPLKILDIHRDYEQYLRSTALFVDEKIYFGNEQGMFSITKENNSNDDDDDDDDLWRVKDLEKMAFGSELSILSHQSKFYRQRPSEAIISEKEYSDYDDSEIVEYWLKFKQKIQFNHIDEVTTCELDKLQTTLTQYGEYNSISNTDQLLDPEKYVDTDIQLSKRYKKEGSDDIWSHINANVTPELIHMYRDNIYENNPVYSFHGLYQKFSYADLLELDDFLKGRKQRENEIDMSNLIASFYGNSTIEILFSNHKMLRLIANKLQEDDLPRKEITKKGQRIEIENLSLRRIQQVLSVHEISASRTSKETNTPCNSLLYKGMYYKRRINYDTLLNIANKCNEFSLQNFLVTADDLQQVLSKPTQQICQALNEIFIATTYTLEIKELKIFSDMIGFWHNRMKIDEDQCLEKVLQQNKKEQTSDYDFVQKAKWYFFNFYEYSALEEEYAQMQKAKGKDEEEDEIEKEEAKESLIDEIDNLEATLNPVSVKVLKLNQKENEYNIKLLENLIRSSDEDFGELMKTKFVKSMFDANLKYYQKEIIRRYFLPYVLYMISMLLFLTFALHEDISNRNINGCVFHLIYYPLLVCCIVFTIKQIEAEIEQLKVLGNIYSYLTVLNTMDITYITLNIVIMLLNFSDVIMLSNLDVRRQGRIKLLISWYVVDYDNGTINLQRKLAAVSASLLWFRLYDWFRLQESTALYYVLIKNTIVLSKDFIAIIGIFFMVFGSFVYFLNMGQQPEEEMMTSRFGFAYLDILQNQYEQTLGEYNLEQEQPITKEMMTLIFTAATFIIIIVLLNMLIAIMGDIFDRTIDQREQSRQRILCDFMCQYIKIIPAQEHEQIIDEQVQNQAQNFKNFDYFYIVESQAERQLEEDTWDGSVTTIKKFIDNGIKKQMTMMHEELTKNSKIQKEQQTALEKIIKKMDNNKQKSKQELRKNQNDMKENQKQMKENQEKMQKNQQKIMEVLARLEQNQLEQNNTEEEKNPEFTDDQ